MGFRKITFKKNGNSLGIGVGEEKLKWGISEEVAEEEECFFLRGKTSGDRQFKAFGQLFNI